MIHVEAVIGRICKVAGGYVENVNGSPFCMYQLGLFAKNECQGELPWVCEGLVEH
jgi:hypothetical protein